MFQYNSFYKITLFVSLLFVFTGIYSQSTYTAKKKTDLYSDSTTFDESNTLSSIKLYKGKKIVLSFNLNDTSVTVNPKAIKWIHSSNFSIFKVNLSDNKEAVKGTNYKIYYVGFFLNGKIFDNSFKDKYLLDVDTQTGQLLGSFRNAIAAFKSNEIGLIKIDPKNAYGKEQAGNIPPNSTLYYLIQITEVK